MTSLRVVCSSALAVLLAAACPSVNAQSTATLVAAAPAPAQFPVLRNVQGYALRIHAPQIRSWPDFTSFEAQFAFEITPPGGKRADYGTASVTGTTRVDFASRVVHVASPKVVDVKLAGSAPPGYADIVRGAVLRSSLDVPLDIFLAHVADGVVEGPAPAGFNTTAPPILVRSAPTILLFVNGSPVGSDLQGTGLQVVVNANWPTFSEAATGHYYLLDRDLWLTAPALRGPWVRAKSLPDGFSSLPAGDEFAGIRAAVPLRPSATPVPTVVVASQPTELIVTQGAPALEALPGAGGLQWVTNTESPLFKVGSTWYFLASGRWFTTADLDKGPWVYTHTLPDAFAQIPASGPRSEVRASVPGTVEARMAVLEASIPATKTVAAGSAPPVQVTYAGDPKFEPIGTTGVSRAANSGFDVLLYSGTYYLCYQAAWYSAAAPTGPWAATGSVPAAVYTIPPDSPAYNLTAVKVAESSTTSTVTYSYLPAYATGMYVAYGALYYGTGWYYPPYIWGPVYYPYWATYGHGSWYNPATGAFASRSVVYGPYGGFSYTQGYNPATGRYGELATAWDGDQWASHGQTWNPRTGTSTDTWRNYDADTGHSSMDRTVQRGDQSMQTERNTDWKQGTSTVDRTTSGGGSMDATRTFDDGTMTKDSTITTASGQSVDKTTVRGDGHSTTVAQGSGGDMYAGHDGNVYRKTDDGWQHYDDGWQPVTPPDGRGAQGGARTQYQPQAGGRDVSQLDRDFSARQAGGAQFQQRAGGFQRGGGRRR
jgi:hypothetical protein